MSSESIERFMLNVDESSERVLVNLGPAVVGAWVRYSDHERIVKGLEAQMPTRSALCPHSMFKSDCLSCWQSHAEMFNQQLRKLETSTALPVRERIEKAVREHMESCYQVYKGVPPTVDDWVAGALHYVMWGIDRDLPIGPSLSDAIKEVEKMRDENNRNYGYWKSVSSNPDTDLGVLKFAAWAGEDERVITALKSLGPQRED